MRFMNKLVKSKNKKFQLAVGLVFAVAGLLVTNTNSRIAPTASASVNCNGSGNSIMASGTGDRSTFISRVRGNSELQHIYADPHFGGGLSSAQYADFAAHAQTGYADINGGIYVNGNKVASDAGTIGRAKECQGPDAGAIKTFNISGTNYYGSPNTDSINHNTPQLSALVLLNAQGKAIFAVITNCGNPLYFTPPPVPPTPKPVQAASCLALNAVVGANPDDYTFTTTTKLTNSPTVNYVVYNFGDKTSSPHVNPAQAYPHSYSTANTYTITATVNATVNGKAVNLPVGPCVVHKTVPKPAYGCQQLVGKLTDNTNNTYTLTVTGVTPTSGVTYTTAVITLGNGKTETVKMKGNTGSYTGATYGLGSKQLTTYNASAVINGTAYGKSFTTSNTVSACKTSINATRPYCSSLAGQVIDNSNDIIKFTATGVPNGLTLKSAVFVFGDGKTSEPIAATTPSTVVTTHDYDTGTYNASATLTFTGTNNKTVPSLTCMAVCTPNAPTCVSECKPNVPIGDVRCNPCTTNPNVTADSPQCVVAPPSLPNTGAGDTIAIFSAVVIGGFIIYRQVLYRQHRAAFVAAEQGSSILPLGDPLNDEAPLADTPLAPSRRSSFRRKRQY